MTTEIRSLMEIRVVGAPLSGGPSTPEPPAAAVGAGLGAKWIAVWCTITRPAEATIAATAGVDALVVQGSEAGGHQASFDDTDAAPVGLLPLLRLIRAVTDLPLVAAGGIT